MSLFPYLLITPSWTPTKTWSIWTNNKLAFGIISLRKPPQALTRRRYFLSLIMKFHINKFHKYYITNTEKINTKPTLLNLGLLEYYMVSFPPIHPFVYNNDMSYQGVQMQLQQDCLHLQTTDSLDHLIPHRLFSHHRHCPFDIERLSMYDLLYQNRQSTEIK